MPPAAPVENQDHRKATGAYYTPAPLIKLLLDYALPRRINGTLKILDPACGQGDFLRAAHQRLHPAHCQLFGVDIDPVAVAQARSDLSCDDVDPARFEIETADALLDPPDFLRLQSFDLILGNPPYVNGIEGNLYDIT